jgi:predicted sulfurtransferase
LNTSSFRETWERLDHLVADLPKDQRILTFCTGGIRCVKVNAYLKQKLGFENIGRLEKGIIAYEKWIEESPPRDSDNDNVTALASSSNNINSQRESLWNGQNFLFDRRRIFQNSEK